MKSLFLFRPTEMYNLLFQTAWETISQFSFVKHRAETGMVAILHTWGQNLSLHPHLHCVVLGGGINYSNQWSQIRISHNRKAFLFPVKNLSVVFRGKFISALNKQLPQEKRILKEIYRTQWVVYAKEPFAGPEQVVDYLGRYTHKVAISNHRLLSVDNHEVRFSYLDYRDNKQKEMVLQGIEFLRRFCQHILPKGFVRIRHYGLLSASRRPILRQLQMESGMEAPSKRGKKPWKKICIENLNFDPDLCPCCKNGKMVTIELILPQRAPPGKISVENLHPVF